jgi:predicted nucleotidyltransferase
MNMRSVGLIAEFNPLHNGHVHALQIARSQAGADAVVVMLAGNYVQRGEPAIVDKWTRAELALKSGADVVVELPVTSVIQAGQQFAAGGVTILGGLGVDALAFGTEDASVDYGQLADKRAAVQDEPNLFHDYTRTYASQLADLYADEVGVKMTAPNQMLALAYAEANRQLARPMTLVPIQRVGAGHDERGGKQLGSGSAIRHAVFAGEPFADAVPDVTRAALQANVHTSWQNLWPLLRYRLLTATLPELRQVDQMAEGLEYRFVQSIGTATDFSDFLHAVKSKRYTYARLRRLALATVLNLTVADVTAARTQPVAHVLGFTATGRDFLHQVKKSATVPIITKVSNDMLAPGGILAMTHRADSLYTTINGAPQNFGRRPLMID